MTILLHEVLQELSCPPRLVQVGDAITEVLFFLKRVQNSDGGWGEYLSASSAVTYVGDALRAFGTIEKPDAVVVQNARNYLLRTQNPDGGWPRYLGGYSDPDNTTRALIGLLDWDEPASSPAILSGLAWLRENYNPTTGGWGTRRESKFIHVVYTARTLRVLLATGSDLNLSRDVAAKLLELQNLDGGWGEEEGAASSLRDLYNVLVALVATQERFAEDLPQLTEALARGRIFLENLQSDKGGWPEPREKDRLAVLSTLNGLWGLIALGGDPVKADNAITWLLQHQNEDGGWGKWKGEPSQIGYTSTVAFVLQMLYISSYWRDQVPTGIQPMTYLKLQYLWKCIDRERNKELYEELAEYRLRFKELDVFRRLIQPSFSRRVIIAND